MSPSWNIRIYCSLCTTLLYEYSDNGDKNGKWTRKTTEALGEFRNHPLNWKRSKLLSLNTSLVTYSRPFQLASRRLTVALEQPHRYPFDRFISRHISPFIDYVYSKHKYALISCQSFNSGFSSRFSLQESNWKLTFKVKTLHCGHNRSLCC